MARPYRIKKPSTCASNFGQSSLCFPNSLLAPDRDQLALGGTPYTQGPTRAFWENARDWSRDDPNYSARRLDANHIDVVGRGADGANNRIRGWNSITNTGQANYFTQSPPTATGAYDYSWGFDKNVLGSPPSGPITPSSVGEAGLILLAVLTTSTSLDLMGVWGDKTKVECDPVCDSETDRADFL